MSTLTKYNEISEFYSNLEFPGRYTAKDLEYYQLGIKNVYLNGIDQHLATAGEVLDIGAGSGLITNLFAQRRPNCTFTAIDISKSILYGEKFAKEHNIINTNWVQTNFLEYNTTKKFDSVICQGVLHHIPDWDRAIHQIKGLVKPGGTVLLGLYHPWGKLLQKLFRVDYQNKILEHDQFQNPFETSFTQTQITKLMQPLMLSDKYPGNCLSIKSSFIQSGGLILYIFKG